MFRKLFAPVALALSLFTAPLYANTEMWVSAAEIAAWDTSAVADTGKFYPISRIARFAMSGTDIGLPSAYRGENYNARVGDQNNNAESIALACAIYYQATGGTWAQTKGKNILLAVGADISSSNGALSPGRNLTGYVIAADLLDLSSSDSTAFASIVLDILARNYGGFGTPSGWPTGTLLACAARRPQNWGAYCLSSVTAAAAWLNRPTLLDTCWVLFQDFVGRYPTVYAQFDFQDGGSQQTETYSSTPNQLRPIAPACEVVDGHNVDGAIIDDWSRSTGGFHWPFYSCEGSGNIYQWDSLEGLTAAAEILYRKGYDSWGAQDNALLRTAEFFWRMHLLFPTPTTAGTGGVCQDTSHGGYWWPSGVALKDVHEDNHAETFISLINKRYGKNFLLRPPSNGTRAGYNVSFTDWTHQ